MSIPRINYFHGEINLLYTIEQLWFSILIQSHSDAVFRIQRNSKPYAKAFLYTLLTAASKSKVHSPEMVLETFQLAYLSFAKWECQHFIAHFRIFLRGHFDKLILWRICYLQKENVSFVSLSWRNGKTRVSSSRKAVSDGKISVVMVGF